MGRQLWLADVLRAAGLAVVEVSGWKTRGDEDYHPRGVIIHETQGSWTSTDACEIRVMIEGREGLAGPIAQVYLSKTGTWHVVTSGQSNHVRVGWAGPFDGVGNDGLLGIEAQHGAGEPWTALQYGSYVRGVAAICKHTGWPPPVGHKEHQPGSKTDPGFDMDRFRRDVAAAMKGETVNTLVILKGDPRVWLGNGVSRRWVKTPAERDAIQAAGAAGRLQLGNGGKLVTVLTQTDLDVYGSDIAELGGTEVAITDVQLDALADKLAARVGQAATPTELEAAAEAAVRKVLGAVDGATPPV